MINLLIFLVTIGSEEDIFPLNLNGELNEISTNNSIFFPGLVLSPTSSAVRVRAPPPFLTDRLLQLVGHLPVQEGALAVMMTETRLWNHWRKLAAAVARCAFTNDP